MLGITVKAIIMKKLSILLTAATLLCSCGSSLIKDKTTAEKIARRVEQRKAWIPAIPASATSDEAQALEFLYAYMPVGDAADFPAELFMSNVRSSLAAQKEMNWGVPEMLFLHFVLPVRINNENLDTSRVDFYAELRDIVRGMPMKEAILAVNHWCHQKVVYTPSDARTSAPSATVRNAAGRCGEESTFTVAALRAVGIPARQVYTPRWAHSDDNHAWVEAWADGEWYYLGACEPEPILNTGWFDAPAARGLLMHTKVFGDYSAEEDVINRTESYTEINVTANYADVAPVEVQVLTADGSAVAGANVDFGIYNYAEFYPAARLTADSAGRATLSAGLGSMVVWANDGVNYGYAQANFGQDKSVKVVLNNPSGAEGFDIVPPVSRAVVRDITPEQRASNNSLLAREDSIRNAYTATFANEKQAAAIAVEIGADVDLTVKYLTAARGNHHQIEKFLRETPREQLSMAFDLLGAVSAKDIRDTPATVLRDHLSGAYTYRGEPYFVEYILNPRVGDELLTPYRTRLSEVGGCATVDELIATTANIESMPELNPAGLWITPLGVHSSRRGDSRAIDAYTIALLRSKGIAARHEPITENLQYYDKTESRWVNIRTAAKGADKGSLKLVYGGKDDPKYYTHFTLARLTDGVFNTIEINPAVGADMGAGLAYSNLFGRPLPLEAGTYRLTSGTRLADGTVLSEVEIFTVDAGRETTVELVMRQDETKVKVIGEMNPESLFVRQGEQAPGSILSTTGRGYFILALVGAKQEPTNHAMRDLAGMREYLEKWGRSVVLVFRDKEQLAKFDSAEFGTLPSNVVVGSDSDGATTAMLAGGMKIANTDNLPVFIIADTFGRVVFFSQGYQIGLGEQLRKVIDNL